MIKISKANAVKMLTEYKSDSFFSVTFVKRTNNQVRKMNCRVGVKKFTKGGGLAFNPADKGLLVVWDAHVKDATKAYRMINLDSVLSFKMFGKEYKVE